MRESLASVLIVACIILPGAAQADIADYRLPNAKTVYYDVHGTDEESISASLNATAPRRPDGALAMGRTDYDYRFVTYHQTQNGVCRVTKMNLQLDITVHLPRLVEEQSLSDGLKTRWHAFMEGLRVHEAGHARIQTEHLQQIKAAGLGSRCDQVRANMDKVSNRVAALQQAYDTETLDGATQGATLR